MDINTDLIRARNDLLREVLTPLGFTVVEQTYKATTFTSKLPDGPEVQGKLVSALAEVDRRMKVILIAGFQRGAAHWRAKDPDRATRNEKMAAKGAVRRGGMEGDGRGRRGRGRGATR
jgi:hypothetical protein